MLTVHIGHDSLVWWLSVLA